MLFHNIKAYNKECDIYRISKIVKHKLFEDL